MSESPTSSLNNWTHFTLKDAYKERPSLAYIVGNLFELPSVSVVFGAPGSFKSFLLADLAGCVVRGGDWLHPLLNPTDEGMPVTQGAAVWLDFDNGERRTLDRFRAIGNATGLSLDMPMSFFSMPYPTLDAGNQSHMTELANKLIGLKAKFVVFDNLGAISGEADENSADMARLFGNLRRLSDTTGSAIVIIHHRRKSNAPSRLGDSLRGHSSIEAAIDLALLVERKQDAPSISIVPTKTRGSDVKPFSAMFTFENDQNEELLKARFYGITDVKEGQERQIMEAIWSILDGATFNKGDLKAKVKEQLQAIGIRKIADVIEDMHQKEYLTEEQGDNNAKIYSRNPEKPFE